MSGLVSFVGSRLREARVARMKTAVWLAEEVGVEPTAISKYEVKNSTPRPEVLDRIGVALRMPSTFFFKPEYEVNRRPFMMRSLAASTKRARDSAEVRTSWLREIVAFLKDVLSFPVPDLPCLFDGSDPTGIAMEEVEDAATRLRRHWGMRDGPIDDLTGLLESKGIVIARFSMNAEQLDAFSIWSTEAPIAVENTDRTNAVRMRFDLAHELGHLVLHQNVEKSLFSHSPFHKLMESQAHRFAAAFLFPATSFMNEVYTVNIDGMLDLKRRWKLSAQMMIRRAFDLKTISEYQYERAFKRVSQAGYRTREPLDDVLESESPALLKDAMRALIDRGGMTGTDVLAALRFSARDVETLTNLPSGFLESTKWGVVVPLRSDPKDE